MVQRTWRQATVHVLVPNEDLERETPSADDDAEVKTSSNWAKNMRKRMFGEQCDEPEESEKKRRRTNCCFNCRGGDHSIAQCPEPKNFAEIRKNKLEFMNDKQQQHQPTGRISQVTEQQQEAKFKPGRLSQNLRKALSLGPDDIPEWVYRMRRLGFYRGYPPGYLRKSLKREFATLKIYSEDHNQEEVDNDDDEEARPAPTIQSEKVHFYMGFNKTYGALRDRERGRFEVPPFDIFCEMLQTEVARDHEGTEKIRIREERHQRSELRKIREQQKEEEEQQQRDSAEKVEKEVTVDQTISEVAAAAAAVEEKPGTPEPVGRMGESISEFIGTPIFSRRDVTGTWIEDTVPSLEAFSVGIVPFEAKEEEKPRGIFKKIMSTLKGITGRNSGDDEMKKKE